MRRLALFLLVVLAGCPPPKVVDQPATDLDVTFNVLDTDSNPSDGMVPIIVDVRVDGALVAIAATSTFTCDSVPLADTALGYAARVPLVEPGGDYTFAFTRQGVVTTVAIPAQTRPVITAPTGGASVTRSTSLSIAYGPGGGKSIVGFAAAGASTVLGTAEADTGAYTGFDVSTLTAGSGTLAVQRTLEVDLSGTGFQAAHQVLTTSSDDVPVVWQ